MASVKQSIINSLQGRKITSQEDVKNSQAFCMKPWLHLFVSHYGTVAPCCLTPWDEEGALGNINQQSVQEIWDGKLMHDFRKKMLRDERDSRCSQCYESEKMGLRSSRHMTNYLYADKINWALDTDWNGQSKDAKPITWDIRVSNLCNFRCRICGHHSSSQWYEDAKALGLVSHDTRLHHGVSDFSKLLQQLEFVLPDLEEVYFAGGEPLIMEEHYRILNMLIEKGRTDVRLCYATNFSQTTYKGTSVFDLWAKFKDVNVFASLDGNYKRGEYQRKGQNWNQVLENRKRMLEVCPEVDFLITPTISVFSIFALPDFHREWVEAGLAEVDDFMPHTLRHPMEYNLRILPASTKQKIADKIEAHINWLINYAKANPPKPPKQHKLDLVAGREEWLKADKLTGHLKLDLAINEYRNSVTFMNAADETHLLPQFKKMCADLDALRKEDTAAIFPELEEALA